MAGPIIEALQRFRDSRQERVQRRRGVVRDLLNPFDSIGQSDQMQGLTVSRRPLQRGGLFASLGGNQTSRQDMRGSPMQMPSPRVGQDNPAGPDTVRARDYDGDGNTRTPAMQVGQKARLPMTAAANPDRTYGMAGPQPVQGGMESLPNPAAPASRRDQLLQQRDQARAGMQGIVGQLRDTSLTPAQLAQMPYQAVAQQSLTASIGEELAALDEQEQGSLKYKNDQLTAMVPDAISTGEWHRFDQTARGLFAMAGKDGTQISDPSAGRNAAIPYIQRHAQQVFEQYNGLAGVPTDARASMLRSLAYAYPISPAAINNNEASEIEQRRISSQLNGLYNLDNNAEKADYFNSLAIQVVGLQGGYKD